jgi:hypothetical protein
MDQQNDGGLCWVCLTPRIDPYDLCPRCCGFGPLPDPDDYLPDPAEQSWLENQWRLLLHIKARIRLRALPFPQPRAIPTDLAEPNAIDHMNGLYVFGASDSWSFSH